MAYPPVISYNGFGSTSQPSASPSAFQQQEGESDVEYALRLTRTYLPTVSELVAGKSAAEKVVILQAKMRSMEQQGLLDFPIIGAFYFRPRYEEYAAAIPVLQKEASSVDQTREWKMYGVAAFAGAIAGMLFVGFQAVRLYGAVSASKANQRKGA